MLTSYTDSCENCRSTHYQKQVGHKAVGSFTTSKTSLRFENRWRFYTFSVRLCLLVSALYLSFSVTSFDYIYIHRFLYTFFFLCCFCFPSFLPWTILSGLQRSPTDLPRYRPFRSHRNRNCWFNTQITGSQSSGTVFLHTRPSFPQCCGELEFRKLYLLSLLYLTYVSLRGSAVFRKIL